MLGWMRSFVKSPIAVLVLGLVGAAMVITLPDAFRGVSMGGGFVTIGDREVTAVDVSREVEREIENQRRENGQILTARQMAEQRITEQLLERRIQRQSILAYAEKIGVRASPTAVNNYLSSAPQLKDPLGRLDMNKVQQIAAEQKMTLKQFQDDIRDEMTIQYIVQAAFGDIKTPDVLMKPMLAYYGEQRTLTIARINDKTLSEPKAPTPDEIKTYYEANKDRFREPERRRISVLSYSSKDFVDKVNVTEEQVQAEFNRRIKEFSGPETREVIQFSGKDRATAQNFIDIVKQGNSLEDAVKKSPGIDRVDLTLRPGDLTDKAYNDQVFGVPANMVNQILGPVKVGEAYYAVQVKSITPGPPRPLAEVAPGLSEGLRNAAATKMFNDSEESFYDMAGGTSLEDIGKNIGAPIIQLAAVDASGRTREGAPATLLLQHAEAFKSLFTLGEGQMTDVVEDEITDNLTGAKLPARFIFRVDQIIAPAVPPIAEIETNLRNAMMAQRVQEAADKAASDIVAAVKAGTPFAKAAADQKMTVLASRVVNRAQQQPEISPAVVNGAFDLKQGDVALVKGEGGEPWVVQVDKVEPVAPETATMIRTQLTPQLQQSVQRDLQQIFLRGVNDVVKPKRNERAIQAYLDSLTKDEAQ
jgi:peptidyl-prolyl cis-trans isomerase D